jgi:aminoglycoside phosphotransferase (APT) family kinase protein
LTAIFSCMPESTRPRIQLVLDRYLPGTSIESIGPLEGGVSATMAKVHVRLPDGNSGSVVVRTPGKWTQEEPPGFIEREFDTLQKVHRAGILSPKPVGLEPPGPEDRFYLLEYIEGAPLLNPSDPAGFGCRFAELHAMIHGLDLEQNGLLEIRRLATKIRQAGKGAGQYLQE